MWLFIDPLAMLKRMCPPPAPRSLALMSGRFTASATKFVSRGLLLETNFVADAVNLPLISAKERGAGGGHIRFNMAKGSMNSHISQFPVGTYKKAHCHGPGAHA